MRFVKGSPRWGIADSIAAPLAGAPALFAALLSRHPPINPNRLDVNQEIREIFLPSSLSLSRAREKPRSWYIAIYPVYARSTYGPRTEIDDTRGNKYLSVL